MKSVNLFILLLALMALSTGAAQAQTQIHSWADLHNVRNNMSGSYKLMTNLDENSPGYHTYASSSANGGQGWLPIGGNFTGGQFRGTFDGDGHTITGLYINRPDHDYAGLFANVSGDGVVKNHGLEDVDITVGMTTGGLVGASVGSVHHSYVNGSVSGTWMVGGLVGRLSVVNPDRLGSITNSYSTATVTTRTNYVAGGLVGMISEATITNSYSTGQVIGSGSTVRGFIGTRENGTTVNNSYWNTETSGRGQGVGNGSIDGITGLDSDEMREVVNFNSWNFSSVWGIVEGGTFPYLQSLVPETLPGLNLSGSGTPSSPYLITSPYELHLVRYALNSHIKLMADIDLDVAPYNVGSGWEPIGTGGATVQDIDKIFAGSFNGNGYTISGLYINRPESAWVGLFGAVNGPDISIFDLRLSNVNITGLRYVGGLAGFFKSNEGGSIFNVYVDGIVTGMAPDSEITRTGGMVGSFGSMFLGSNVAPVLECGFSGTVSSPEGSYVGGLAGQSYGSNTFTNTWAHGSVSTGGTGAGGLIGSVTSSTITQSFSTASVSGGDASDVGGLVGRTSNGSISNSYAMGAVSGGDFITTVVFGQTYFIYSNVGGLLGSAYNNTNISNSYASGYVSGGLESITGGLVGELYSNHTGTLSGNYWDTQTSGKSNAVGSGSSAGNFGKTSDEMRIQATFSGWNFGSIWGLIDEQSYPWLQNNEQNPHPGLPPFAGGSGTTGDPYLISTAYNLDQVRNHLDAHFLLTSDIDLTTSTRDGGVFWNDGAGWSPIGNESAPFTGTFDGGGHIITGLYINRQTQSGVGLFGWANAQVTGLGLLDLEVSGDRDVAGLVGRGKSVISESFVSGSVTGAQHTALLIGWLESDIDNSRVTDSYAYGAVSGVDVAGGLVGRNSGTVTRGYARVWVSGSEAAGALVGWNEGSLSASYWPADTDSIGVGNGTATGATGLTVVQMLFQQSFSGWDFDDTWGITQKASFPYLLWEGEPGSHVSSSDEFSLVPIGLTAQPGNQSVVLAWSAPASASPNGYRIYRNSELIQTGDLVTDTTFTDTGLTNFTAYNWQVTAVYHQYEEELFESDLSDLVEVIPTNLTDGDGTETNPYLIANVEQLNGVRYNPDAHYRLTADIDLSELTREGGIFGNDGLGWDPIGDTTIPFTGSFDGKGHTINGLYINRGSTGNIGFFGLIGSGGVVNNLGLTNVDITGGGNTGGLVGRNAGGALEGNYVTGSVIGGTATGGMLGRHASGTIARSYASGTVSGGNRSGGLVGESSGTITTSYFTGTVSGNNNTGGLIGYHTGGGSLTSCYVAVSVSGALHTGGLTGDSSNGSVSGCYLNTDLESVGLARGSTSGTTGLSTVQMRQQSNFPGFDFSANG
ncbi:MAG: hypothetical protein LAT57_11615, partial [Balneolales bacterium]|nr:hypothetical protein [Balneolales bacterium]